MVLVLEALVTTLDDRGGVHLAPMGPHVEGNEIARFELRPFPSSLTFQNLKRHGEGVLHITDDVLVLARAAIVARPLPPCEPASIVQGYVLADCCRFFEFRVTAIDESHERVRIGAETVHRGWKRDFFGFNRAKHAVVEAAILATRRALLPAEQIAAEFARLQILVEKTGGSSEREAFALLSQYVAAAS
jgi:uncharacterized protein